MAKKTIVVCDSCDTEIADGTQATVVVKFAGVTRKGDLCETCAGVIPTSTSSQPARRARTSRESATSLDEALAP